MAIRSERPVEPPERGEHLRFHEGHLKGRYYRDEDEAEQHHAIPPPHEHRVLVDEYDFGRDLVPYNIHLLLAREIVELHLVLPPRERLEVEGHRLVLRRTRQVIARSG